MDKFIEISDSLSENKSNIEETLANCDDLLLYPWHYGPELKYRAFSVYLGTLVQDKQKNYMKQSMQDLVSHEIGQATEPTPEDVIHFFNQNGVSDQNALLIDQFDDAVAKILSGHVVIFFDFWNKAIAFNDLSINKRQVTEPATESVVKGPRESTIEQLDINIGLLRVRLQNPRFKIEKLKTGGETKTEIAYGYLEGKVDSETLAEFKRRIEYAKQFEILETAYIEELIEDSKASPFPQYRYTERPDVAVAALLQGKIVVLVQGTGSILICPGLFTEFFQSSEDYYQRTLFSSLIRFLRVITFFLALLLPSLYIALTTFHTELIPTNLLMAIIDTREGLPLPAFLEAVIMVFLFEVLREAGIRLPQPIGSAISIVGALIIGEAAISANITSPLMVIIVALTGIASFSIPQYNIAIPLRILQIPMMIFSATLGGFGIMVFLLIVLLHLANLRSLGQPYFSPLTPLQPKQLLDVFVRRPQKWVSYSNDHTPGKPSLYKHYKRLKRR
ncbi:spore germination protein [Halalkalibacter alkalisediminis]|uniref:Spore germination protein n=1 Tax=Halalkalibacter alkalisediminis TaxID=935616 RepID=A0ABV6NKX6_9BACI|nr:spore germination protein [Halalkalibacter alkalisediminis]